MQKRLIAVLVATSAMAFIVPAASGDPEECRDAVDQYSSAIADVSDTLKRYADCVSSSKGHDDCSTEFRRLKDAQDDFESAVSDYSSECE
jgi:hypothetical protein